MKQKEFHNITRLTNAREPRTDAPSNWRCPLESDFMHQALRPAPIVVEQVYAQTRRMREVHCE
jgi:hypothetical protein